MAEHTAVCDCGMPIVIDSTWVGRHVRCPHCRTDFIVQSNLTVLPPSDASAAAAAMAASAAGTGMPLPAPPGVPYSQAARPVEAVDTGEDLDITLSPPKPATGAPPPPADQPPAAAATQQPLSPAAAWPPPVTPGASAPLPAEGEPPAPGARPSGPQLRTGVQGPPLVVEFEEGRWMPLTALIVGLASLPAVLLWGIGSLIAGATALVLGSDARRRLPEKVWMSMAGMISGSLGIVLSIVYWLLWWARGRGG